MLRYHNRPEHIRNSLISIPKGMPIPAGQGRISTVQQLKLALKDEPAKFGSGAIKRSMSVWAMSNSPGAEKCLFRRKPWEKRSLPQLLLLPPPGKLIPSMPQYRAQDREGKERWRDSEGEEDRRTQDPPPFPPCRHVNSAADRR